MFGALRELKGQLKYFMEKLERQRNLACLNKIMHQAAKRSPKNIIQTLEGKTWNESYSEKSGVSKLTYRDLSGETKTLIMEKRCL